MSFSDWSAIRDFSFCRLDFRFIALEPISLPDFQGATFRGAFGYAFHDTVCCTHISDCGLCSVKDSCIYRYVFETAPPADAVMMRLYPTVPHPFVFSVPDDARRELAPGDSFSLGVTLVGKAVAYLPHFVYAFIRSGQNGLGSRRGRFELEAVVGCAPGGEEEVYASGRFGAQPPVTRGSDLFDDGSGPVRLTFKTPLRVKFESRYTTAPDFHVLMRALLRRVSALQYFHCGKALELDYRGVIEAGRDVRTLTAEVRWKDWGRYSTRQKTRIRLGGLVGSVTYDEKAADFLPLLRLGEALHLGKAATFGMGQYAIE